jgi:hypothetical protein
VSAIGARRTDGSRVAAVLRRIKRATTLHRSFAFRALLIVLTVIEEAIIGVMHGRTALDPVAGIAGGTFHQMVATSAILLLMLVAFRAAVAGSITFEWLGISRTLGLRSPV